jgi:N utilization substance protein B
MMVAEVAKSRSRAREFAFSVVYASAFHQPEEVDRVYRDLLVTLDMEGKLDPLARRLVDLVVAHAEAIDALFAPKLRRWTVERLANVDRWVLRLGVAELRYLPETPSSVVIDEAVELAKRYGGARSGAFVNGVLDAVARDLQAGLEGRGAGSGGGEGEPTCG